MKHLVFAVCAIALLCGCSQTKKTAPKEGRIAVQSTLQSEKIKKSTTGVVASKAVEKTQHTQAYSNAQNLLPHATLKNEIKETWATRAGEGLSYHKITLAEPIIANDVIYTLDTNLTLFAIDAKTGDKKWKLKLTDRETPALASMGLAYDSGIIYAVSGNGEISAVDETGTLIWQKELKAILRSAPIIQNKKLFVLSGNNDLFVLNTKDGSTLWQYKNIVTETNLMGMARPAIMGNTAIVPFSSGETIAFNINNGSVIWSESVFARRSFNQINDLAHIVANPVIKDGIVYIISNANKTIAFNAETGSEIFSRPIGGQTTPSLIGNTLYIVTSEDKIVALNKHTGNMIWQKDLYNHKNKMVAWHTPIPAENKLIITSNAGDLIVLDAKTGEEIKKEETSKLAKAPIPYKNGLLLYTEDAKLIMYQ